MRTKTNAYLLLIFAGGLSAHQFYLGRPISGMLQITTFGGFGLWWLLDLFFIPRMVRRANEAKLAAMTPPPPPPRTPEMGPPRVRPLEA